MAELQNAKHEAYARAIAAGMKQKDAYIQVFPRAEGWKDQTIYNRSSELSQRPEVAQRVKELQQTATSAAILTITQRKEWLSRLIQNEEEATPNRLKALDTLNKMDGAYVEQINVNGSINNPFTGLTTDELRKITAELVRDG